MMRMKRKKRIEGSGLSALILAAAVVGGPLAAPSLAEQPGASKQAEGALKQASGKVVSVDKNRGVLMLKSEALPSPKEFILKPDTAILSGQQRLSLNDLKPDMPVNIEYTEQEGRGVARQVRVQERGKQTEVEG